MPQIGPQAILQRYSLLRKIATGGMAEVYLAEQTGAGGFKKRVAIKRILPAFAEDPKFVEMFLDEARLAAMFHHPNLIQIYELGEIDGLLSLVMEYVRGLSLSELLRRAAAKPSPLPAGIAARIVAEACEGLHYAHEFQDPDTGEALGLVHRDVSPQNILISKEGLVKVMDFGIAKAAGQMHHTSTGTLKGKLSYMPPEQLEGAPLDRRADVWALGVVLYELLAGRRPFAADSEAGVFRAILQEEPPPLSEIRPDLPPALRAAVEGALSRNRGRRTPTAAALGKALEEFLTTGPRIGSAEVAEWVKPLLPAAGEAGAAMLTPSNLSSQALQPARPAGEPPRPAEPPPIDLPTQRIAAREDPSLQLPPLPERRVPWPLWIMAAFAGTLAMGGTGVLISKLGDRAVAAPSAQIEQPPPLLAQAPPTAAAPAATAPAPLPPPPAAVAPVVVGALPAAAAAQAESPTPRGKHREATRRHRPAAATGRIGVAVAGPPGSLLVNTEPWSRVTLDGRDVGQTPISNLALPAGRHTLVCTNPDTGLVHRETVVIPPGGRVKRLIQLTGAE